MHKLKQNLPLILGLLACLITLGLAVAVQLTGYYNIIDSDLASEVLLGRMQYLKGEAIPFSWMHSTEIHILGPHALYALSFLFQDSYRAARIIGNTAAFALGMAACVFLLRGCGFKRRSAVPLFAAALMPVTASGLYAFAMTIGGVYLFQYIYLFLVCGLWLRCMKPGRHRLYGALLVGLSFVMGMLSVRYVLCFLCPMAVTGVMLALFCGERDPETRQTRIRGLIWSLAAFAACTAGYGVSEFLYPRLFCSGVGAASGFTFGELNASALISDTVTVFVDFLKLLGWRSGAPLFSAEGMVNFSLTAALILGGIMVRRVFSALDERDEDQRLQKTIIWYALSIIGICLFTFVLITYLNRYMISCVLLLIPVLAICLQREKSLPLKVCFCLMLCGSLALSSMLQLRFYITQAHPSETQEDIQDASLFLMENGYTHGYGGFWDVRLAEEYTSGALTFTGVNVQPSEENALCASHPEFIRWLESNEAAALNVCPGKTFLMASRGMEEDLDDWLKRFDPPVLYRNRSFTIYGFDSSESFVNAMRLGSMTLENSEVLTDDSFMIREGGRLRIPPSLLLSGDYTVKLSCGAPSAVLRLYTGRTFKVLSETVLSEGENSVAFSLPGTDKYFMLQILAPSDAAVTVSDLKIIP